MKYQDHDLPLFRSHKIVGALKIATAIHIGGTSNCKIVFEDSRFLADYVDLTNKPSPCDGWYMVWYEDGYISFSPPEAFEHGYDLVPDLSQFEI